MKEVLIKTKVFNILPRWRIVKETGKLTNEVNFYVEILRKTWFFNVWERIYDSYHMEYISFKTFDEAKIALNEYAELHEKGYYKYQLIKMD